MTYANHQRVCFFKPLRFRIAFTAGSGEGEGAAEMSRQKPQAVGIFYICMYVLERVWGEGCGRGNCLPYAAAFWLVQMLPLATAAPGNQTE